MKVEKNKIVFAAVLVVIFIFLISYSMMVMGDDESENENLEQTLVPDLDENQKEYDSKLDAIKAQGINQFFVIDAGCIIFSHFL